MALVPATNSNSQSKSTHALSNKRGRPERTICSRHLGATTIYGYFSYTHVHPSRLVGHRYVLTRTNITWSHFNNSSCHTRNNKYFRNARVAGYCPQFIEKVTEIPKYMMLAHDTTLPPFNMSIDTVGYFFGAFLRKYCQQSSCSKL